MRYPADMVIEITKEIEANIEQGISILDSIDMAYEIARKYGICRLDPTLESFVRACYGLKIGPEVCAIIDREVSKTVHEGGDKVSAIMNAIESVLVHTAWTRVMHYYAIEIYYDKAYVDVVTSRIE